MDDAEHFVDQRDLNDALQTLKVGCEKFGMAAVRIRAGGAEGMVLQTLRINQLAAADGQIADIRDAVVRLVTALGGEVMGINPEEN